MTCAVSSYGSKLLSVHTRRPFSLSLLKVSFFTQRKFCYFVVWTSKDVAVVKIEQDETWDANIPVLKEFYFKHIFLKLVEGAL